MEQYLHLIPTVQLNVLVIQLKFVVDVVDLTSMLRAT